MITLGPLYGGTLRYWHKKFLPIIEKGTTQETEMPYRHGKCLVFRMPYTNKSIYLGVLFKTVSDPRHLTDEDIDLLMEKALRARTAWTPDKGSYDETF